MKMKKKAMELNLMINENEDDGGLSYIVKGEQENLQEFRKLLDEANFNDDSPLACPMMGMTPAKETISFLMVCEFGGKANGYMAAA